MLLPSSRWIFEGTGESVGMSSVDFLSRPCQLGRSKIILVSDTHASYTGKRVSKKCGANTTSERIAYRKKAQDSTQLRLPCGNEFFHAAGVAVL
jgi:hypothetical protein